MSIGAKSNSAYIVRQIRQQDKQAQFALVVALTRTAYKAKDDLRNEMQSVFDRPTPYTLNSIAVRRATTANPTAELYIKGEGSSGKGVAATKYLTPEVYGGSRSHKRFERALQARGLMPSGMYVVPAGGAKLDQYGNASRGQMTQILSQLKVQLTSGYDSAASNSAASKRSRRRQGVTYFSLPRGHGKLKPGIYLRRDFAHGSEVKPVFLFVSNPSYNVRLPFHKIVEQSAQRNFQTIYKDAMAYALSTAK